MGNYRFRLSDMMPNAWFYKIKEMGTRKTHAIVHPKEKKQPTPTLPSATHTSKSPKQPIHSHSRKSYYFARGLHRANGRSYSSRTKLKTSDALFPEPPRQFSEQTPRRRSRVARTSPRYVSSSVSAGFSCRALLESVWTKSEFLSSSPCDSSPEPEFRTDRVLPTESSDEVPSWSNDGCFQINHHANDVLITAANESPASRIPKVDGLRSAEGLRLPPIITNSKLNKTSCHTPTKMRGSEKSKKNRSSFKLEGMNAKGYLPAKIISSEEKIAVREQRIGSARKFSGNSPKIRRLRINSPRISSKKTSQSNARKSVSSNPRKSLSGSLAIVKSSSDPQRDFRESMVEMIAANNIRASKDLEDLLVCYLSLNADEYHGLIINVFRQIWFDLSDTLDK